MRKLITTALLGGALALAMPAAAATLLLGDNSLTAQVHADPNSPQGANTVFGLVKPSDVSVSFQSGSTLNITGGNGYAQISDFNTGDANPLDDLSLFLTTDPNGITGLEFTIQYGARYVSNQSPAFLQVVVDFLGGGQQTFSYLNGDPVLGELAFKNSSAKDFRLQADGNEVFSKITLLSTQPFDQLKQTDIELAPGAPALPEPSSWAMMIAGFGFIGAAMRRSKARPGLAFA